MPGIGAFPTGGIGPHEMQLMPDGTTLVVANGGIETDPTDRSKLNIDSMRPNLAYLSLDGGLQGARSRCRGPASELHPASRGPFGWAGRFRDAVAGRSDGAATPLLGLHRMGRADPGPAPLADELAMRGYAGSVAFSGDGAELAITSPRGGRLHRFAPGAFLGGRAPRGHLRPRPA